jgi:hypothetical protein
MCSCVCVLCVSVTTEHKGSQCWGRGEICAALLGGPIEIALSISRPICASKAASQSWLFCSSYLVPAAAAAAAAAASATCQIIDRSNQSTESNRLDPVPHNII